jgi:hypothetical protein
MEGFTFVNIAVDFISQQRGYNMKFEKWKKIKYPKINLEGVGDVSAFAEAIHMINSTFAGDNKPETTAKHLPHLMMPPPKTVPVGKPPKKAPFSDPEEIAVDWEEWPINPKAKKDKLSLQSLKEEANFLMLRIEELRTRIDSFEADKKRVNKSKRMLRPA